MKTKKNLTMRLLSLVIMCAAFITASAQTPVSWTKFSSMTLVDYGTNGGLETPGTGAAGWNNGAYGAAVNAGEDFILSYTIMPMTSGYNQIMAGYSKNIPDVGDFPNQMVNYTEDNPVGCFYMDGGSIFYPTWPPYSGAIGYMVGQPISLVYSRTGNNITVTINGTPYASETYSGMLVPHVIIWSGNGTVRLESATITDPCTTAPAVPGAVSGSAYIAPNDTGRVYSVAPVATASTYTWTVPTGLSIVSGQGTTSITVNAGSSCINGSIIVKASNSCGTGGSRAFSVNSKPATPVTVTGSTYVLPNASGQTYSTPLIPGATTYTWTVPANVTIASGQGTNTITCDFGAAFYTGNITVKASNACGTSGTRTVPVKLKPETPGPITGNSYICANTTGETFSIPSAAGATSYTWTVPSTVTITSGQGTTSITCNFGSSWSSGSITVTASNSNTSSDPFSMIVRSKPQSPGPIASPPSGICPTATFSIAPVTGATSYTWTAPSGVTITSGQGTTSINASISGSFNTGTLSVIASNNCGSSGVRTLFLRAVPLTPGTISGTTDGLCPAGISSAVYTIADVAGASGYLWTAPSGASITSGQGTTSVTVSFGSSFTSGNLSVIASSNCGNSPAKTLALRSSLAAPAAISGTVPGGWTQRSDVGGVGRWQVFSFSIGSKGYFGGGATGWDTGFQQDFWEFDPTTNTWTQKADYGGGAVEYAVGFSIGGIGYAGTGYSGHYRKDFWAYNPATNSWSQKADFGGTGRYGAFGFAIGSKGYIGSGAAGGPDFWEYDPSSDSWSVKASYPGNGTYAVASFSIGSKGYAGTGSGANDFWEYDPSANAWSAKTSIPGGGRQWGKGFSLNGKGYMGMGGNKEIYEYDPASNSWVQKQSYPGLGSEYVATFTIGSKAYMGTGNTSKDFWEYDPVSSSTAITTGLCPAGISSQTFTVPAVAGASSYTWTAPAGTTITSGQGTNTVTVSFGSSFTSGNLSVIANNGCGSSPSTSIALRSTLLAPGIISGQTSGLCVAGTSSATYTIAAVAGASSYIWTAPSGASISAGQGTTSVTVSFSSSFNSGNLSVRAVNDCGNSSQRTLALTSVPPQTSLITGNSTVCEGDNETYSISPIAGIASYTWTVPADATIISGQGTTSVTVSYVSSGSISVRANNACGQSYPRIKAITVNACRSHQLLSDNETELSNENDIQINVFPNPSSGIFNIELKKASTEQLIQTEIFDLSGRCVLSQKNKIQANEPLSIDAGDLNTGIYMIRMTTSDHTEFKKIIIK